jgi:hypothetical protein
MAVQKYLLAVGSVSPDRPLYATEELYTSLAGDLLSYYVPYLLLGWSDLSTPPLYYLQLLLCVWYNWIEQFLYTQ